MKSEYAQKLLDPRWQMMRLEILSRDKFTCKSCGDKTKTLHVHHCFYERGKDPWDYPESSLITLCCDCHENETGELKNSKDYLVRIISSRGALYADFDKLREAIEYSQYVRPDLSIRQILDFFSEQAGQIAHYEASK